MAQAPAKRCPIFPCSHKMPCPVHGSRDRWRQSSAKRGYDREWQKTRAAYLAQFPLCQDCEEQGRLTPAEEVHHLVKPKGPGDPMFHDPANLRSLCVSCHSKRTVQGQ
jgi:5-methylcytosine-specific restriction protein A